VDMRRCSATLSASTTTLSPPPTSGRTAAGVCGPPEGFVFKVLVRRPQQECDHLGRHGTNCNCHCRRASTLLSLTPPSARGDRRNHGEVVVGCSQ
jgi:hypothetical protein